MALQLWMPMMGNLKNQGLCNVSPGGEFEAIDSGRKCIKTGTTTSIDTGLEWDKWDFSSKSISLCGWFRFNQEEIQSVVGGYSYTSNNPYPKGILLGFNSYGGFGLVWQGQSMIDSELTSLYVFPVLRTTGFSRNTSSVIVPFNTWTHIAAVWDIADRKLSLYINGELRSFVDNIPDFDSTSFSHKNVWVNYPSAWGGHAPAFRIPFYCNDIRVYDHCLSPKEVKELSKGLVVHFKMDDIIPSTLANLVPFKLTSDNYTISDHANRTHGSISNGVYHVDGWQSETSADTSFTATSISFITLLANTDYYLSFYCKCKNNTNVYFHSGVQAHTVLVDSSDTKYYPSENVSLGMDNEGWISLRIHTGTDTQYKIRLGFDGPNLFGEGSFIEFSNVMLSLDKPDCYVPYEYDRTRVIDTSGYENNGVVTGSLAVSEDSARYGRCVDISATNTYITCQKMHFPEITIVFWIRRNALSGTRKFIYTEWPGISIEFTANNSWLVYYTHNSSLSTVTCNPTTTLQAGIWYHVALVIGVSGVKSYINGVLEASATYKEPYYGTNPCRIGSYSSLSNPNLDARISDFRIYATHLSASDIKELYDTAAIIDNRGDLMCYEAIEEKVDTHLKETGQILLNNFIEVNEAVYLPAGTYIKTGLTINAGDTCRAETIIRYKTSGDGSRDLMGYSSAGAGYWGVKANGTWEPHGTFTYTDADITKKNEIIYQFHSASEHGEYIVGALATSYSTRDKYIYRVRLYRNGVLERDLYPIMVGDKVGLIDALTHEYYLANNAGGELLNEAVIEASVFDDKIEVSQLIEA